MRPDPSIVLNIQYFTHIQSKSARTPASSSCPDLINMDAHNQRIRMSYGSHLVPPPPGGAYIYRSLEMDDTDRAHQFGCQVSKCYFLVRAEGFNIESLMVV